MSKPAVALVALTPLVTWVVPTVAAHPALAPLVPLPFERAGALVYVALVFWVAGIEIVGRHAPSPAYRSGLTFAAAAALASVLGFDPLSGVAAAIVFAAVCLAGSGLYRVAREGGWQELLAAWLWSGLAVCALALAALLARWPAAAYAFAHGRAVGIFGNPNELALFALAVCAPAAGAVLCGIYPGRRLALVTLAVGIAALLATGSRSGEAAFGVGVVALAVALRQRRRPAHILAVLVVAAIGIAFALGLDSRHNPAENDTRIAAWQAGLRTVALFPVTGVGVGGYYRIYPFVRPPDAPGPEDPIAFDPHDFYLSVAAETGLVGLAAFACTIVVFVREVRGILSRASEPARRFSLAILAGLLAIACHLIFNGFAICIVLWTVLAALAMGVPRSGYGRAA